VSAIEIFYHSIEAMPIHSLQSARYLAVVQFRQYLSGHLVARSEGRYVGPYLNLEL
jgi:hypothetical protein